MCVDMCRHVHRTVPAYMCTDMRGDMYTDMLGDICKDMHDRDVCTDMHRDM